MARKGGNTGLIVLAAGAAALMFARRPEPTSTLIDLGRADRDPTILHDEIECFITGPLTDRSDDPGTIILSVPMQDDLIGLGAATAPAARPAPPQRTVVRVPRPASSGVRPSQQPRPSSPTMLQQPATQYAMMALPAVPMLARLATGRPLGKGEVVRTSLSTAVSVAGNLSPIAGGAAAAALAIGTWATGPINAQTTVRAMGGAGRGVVQALKVAIPGAQAVWGAWTMVEAVAGGLDSPGGRERFTTGLLNVAGGLVGLATGNPVIGMVIGVAAPYVAPYLVKAYDKVKSWLGFATAETSAAALDTAGFRSQRAGERDITTTAEQTAVATAMQQEQQAWWDAPDGGQAYWSQAVAQAEADDAAAWQLPEAPLDPTLLEEAGADLSTEIVPVEIPTELTAEELAALGLSETEIDIYQHGAEEWTGGFGVEQPVIEAALVEPAPEPVPVLTYDQRAARGEVPTGVLLLGAWDSIITDFKGEGSIAQAAAFCTPGAGFKCRAVYVWGQQDFFSNELATLPGADLATIEKYAT